MAHQVFVSHATEDRETASRVCALLEAEGISCWIAPRDVKVGTDYATAILDAIRTCDLMLLIFSEHADSSPYVVREIERAVAYKRPVLALRIDEYSPSASMEYYVHVWRRLDAAAGLEKKRGEIVAAVRQRLAGAAGAGARGRIVDPRTWSRRMRVIGLAAVLAVVAVGLGLGLGLTRDHGTSGAELVGGQATWTNLNPSDPLPAARYGHVMVQDPTSGRLIMFGGYSVKDATALNDTWAYDPTANTWNELRPAGTLPSGRSACAIAYDTATRRLVMFGGRGETARLGDIWAYDPAANTWTELHPSGAPPPRAGHVIAYDPGSGRLVMFGGRSSETDLLNDAWAYDPRADAWTELAPAGTVPSVRAQPAMAYDPGTRRMIMFGGWDFDTEFNETWAYDPASNTWMELSPEGAPPAARSDPDLIYVSSNGLLIMYGGFQATQGFSDTWSYDAAADIWAKFGASYTPQARSGESMAYDPSGDRLIMFGGSPGDYDVNETWACTLLTR